MNARAVVAMILAYLVPGLGHLFLGRRGRAIAFFLIITSLFLFGLRIDGALYTLATARRALLNVLGSVGSMGVGVLYFIADALGTHGDIRSSTFEYGRMFTLSAGLMNLLLVVDCYEIGTGKKE
jgi:hypothetical protein